MKLVLRGACALLLTGLGAGSALAEDGAPVDMAVALLEDATTDEGAVELASCDTCDSGSCDPCASGCNLDLGCSPACRGQVFFGAEWLNVRANFSEATAYRVIDTVNPGERFEQFNFDYGDSYRVYGGYRLCECGCDIRFTYTNFDSGGSFTPATNSTADGMLVTPPYEVTLGEGDTVIGDASVNVDNYDIGFSKTIPLGCLSPCGGCGDCGACCDPCGCGPVCPAWDITWEGAIRFANVDSRLSWESIRDPANTAAPSIGESTVSFDGAGLRFGVTGRRYFGRSGLISAYVKGDVSLLLGEVEYRVATQPGLPTVSLDSTEVIPVTEIEAGLTAYLTCNLNVSAGYLLSAWHDLGHRAEYDFTNSGSQILSMDDANMMTFDGMFLRAEAAF